MPQLSSSLHPFPLWAGNFSLLRKLAKLFPFSKLCLKLCGSLRRPGSGLSALSNSESWANLENSITHMHFILIDFDETCGAGDTSLLAQPPPSWQQQLQQSNARCNHCLWLHFCSLWCSCSLVLSTTCYWLAEEAGPAPSAQADRINGAFSVSSGWRTDTDQWQHGTPAADQSEARVISRP